MLSLSSFASHILARRSSSSALNSRCIKVMIFVSFLLVGQPEVGKSINSRLSSIICRWRVKVVEREYSICEGLCVRCSCSNSEKSTCFFDIFLRGPFGQGVLYQEVIPACQSILIIVAILVILLPLWWCCGSSLPAATSASSSSPISRIGIIVVRSIC